MSVDDVKKEAWMEVSTTELPVIEGPQELWVRPGGLTQRGADELKSPRFW